MGNLPDGYQLVEVYSNPIKVRVKGTSAVLNTLDRIVIPAEVLDLSGVSSDILKTIDITSYLPHGVSLVLSSDSRVNISAEIEKIETRELKLPIANITTIGLKNGYQLSHTERYLTIYVNAGKTALSQLNVADIKGTINVENLEGGAHLVAVDLQLDDTIYRVNDVLTEVNIVSTQLDTGNNSESDSETETEVPDTESGSVESGSTSGNTPNESTETTETTESTETTDSQTGGN